MNGKLSKLDIQMYEIVTMLAFLQGSMQSSRKNTIDAKLISSSGKKRGRPPKSSSISGKDTHQV